jgi:hypothetical protein
MLTQGTPNGLDGCRELGHLQSHGTTVRLWWHPHKVEFFVQVRNESNNEDFLLAPPQSHALQAFHQPYAFRHTHESRTADPQAARQPQPVA